MSTDTYNILNLVLQGLIWVAMIATFLVYYGQLRAMRTAATGQNILSLVNFLQTSEVRDARTIVRDRLKGKAYPWSDDEKRSADLLCSTYDVAAILIFEQKLVPAEPFVRNWGASIKDCYEVLLLHIQEMQKPIRSGPGYWDDFKKLYGAVVRGNKAAAAGGDPGGVL